MKGAASRSRRIKLISHRIQTPVLLLIGDHEVIYKPEQAIQRATRLVPDLKAEIVPNANHIAEYTAAEVVNQKIVAFFADTYNTFYGNSWRTL